MKTKNVRELSREQLDDLNKAAPQTANNSPKTQEQNQPINNTTEEQNDAQTAGNEDLRRYAEYLRGSIARWYSNAYFDYGVSGRVLDIVEPAPNQLKITWEEIRPEDGDTVKTVYLLPIAWYTEYTPEQVYNIWMEADDAEIISECHSNMPEPEESESIGTDQDISTTKDKTISTDTIPASVKFAYNGIRINGGPLIHCTYVIKTGGSVGIYAGRDARLPATFLPVMAEPGETDCAVLPPVHPLYKYALSAAYTAQIHAKRTALNHYARRAHITPDNAVYIAGRIEALKAEIKQLQAIKTGTGSATPKAIRQALNLRQMNGANTS